MESRNEGKVCELLKWNYASDLDLLKDRFSRIAQSDMGKARDLLMAILNLTRNSTQGQNQNPLDIELILIKVLSYLSVNSLLNCRLVNQTWNSEAVPWIRQKKPIVRVRESSSFPKLCADFEKCDLLPFSTLQLPGKNLENVLQFFIQHGSSVESLTMVDTVLHLESRMALGTIFKCVPNLKALRMHGINRNGYAYALGTPFLAVDEAIPLTQVEYLEIIETYIQLHQNFLDQIFALVPNLKIAHLNLYRQSGQYFQLVAQAMQNLSLTSIITRCYGGVPYSSFWEHIAGSQKLKELNCLELISRPSLELVTAQDFLRSQSESLEVLTLRNQKTHKYNKSNEPALLQFPVMNNLRVLEFGFTYGGTTVVTVVDGYDIPLLVPIEPNQVPRLHFLRNVPPLAIPLFLADSPFTSVQEVELYRSGSGYHTNCDGLPEIGSRFPNLKKLSHLWTDLNAGDMGRIVSNLRAIEELELIVSDYGGHSEEIRVDFSAFIGGITMDQLQTLIQLADPAGRPAVLSWIDTPGPSLRDLKRLTKLKIHFTSKEPNFCFEIDEIGVYLTLLRLSSQLNLTLSGHFSISSNLASKLMAHFKNVYLIPFEQWDGI